MARPAVDDAVSAILDDYGYPRENGWHDPDSVEEIIEEMEGWDEKPEECPGACLSCFEVYAPPVPRACGCGGEVRTLLSLAGYEDEEDD